MFNDYLISPAGSSNSTFLAYNGDQPFASFGSKALVQGVPSMCLPSAPPKDNQPRGLVTEFLRLDASGKIGKSRNCGRFEAGPTGKRKNLYLMDPRSQYFAPILDLTPSEWHAAIVSYEGKRVLMLWWDCPGGQNTQATNLARQEDTVLPAYFHRSGNIEVCGEVYFILRQMWKPYADIHTMRYAFASDLAPIISPVMKKWWRAVWVTAGLWRVYADDMNELFHAKLKIPA
jgi:hypothetical protein